MFQKFFILHNINKKNDILNKIQASENCFISMHSILVGPHFAWIAKIVKQIVPTPADDMAAQIITDCGNFTLDFKQQGFCAYPVFLQTLRP